MNVSDDMILRGFVTLNPQVTKEYFYGYVRKAYDIFDHRYQLHGKAGLDFYSLAHEYYIHLLKYDFRPLTDRPKDVKLSTFMVNGFRYVVLDALKAYNKEFRDRTTNSADMVLEYVRSTDKEEGLMYAVVDAVTAHYHDRKMQELAYEFFVLGYKQNEISKELGMTPSAVNQRYKKMMEEVVTPFVIENYGSGIYLGAKRLDIYAEANWQTSRCNSAAMSGIKETRLNADMLDKCNMRNDTISNNMDNHKQSEQEKSGAYFSDGLQRGATPKANRITPGFITSLKPDEIFVFGSNLHGIHAGGAARMAVQHFGAVMGNGVGMQGQSYAIPTMQGGVETIKPYVDDFMSYAKAHADKTFLVTPIGCGIAGFEPEDIAPLFEAAKDIANIHLPEEFWDELL